MYEELGIFRLNPLYTGTEFRLDDFQKLDEIEAKTEEWLGTCNLQLTLICDHLVAALFFFRALGQIKNGTMTGEILCRLPVHLEARQSVIDKILEETDLNLFVIEFGDGRREHVDVSSLNGVHSGDDIHIPVILNELPDKAEVQIKMRNSSWTQNTRSLESRGWSRISGSPYTLS